MMQLVETQRRFIDEIAVGPLHRVGEIAGHGLEIIGEVGRAAPPLDPPHDPAERQETGGILAFIGFADEAEIVADPLAPLGFKGRLKPQDDRLMGRVGVIVQAFDIIEPDEVGRPLIRTRPDVMFK